MPFPHPLKDRYFEELKAYLNGKFGTLATGITSLGAGGSSAVTLGTIPKKGASGFVDSLLIEDGIRIGLGGTPRITRGFDIFGSNPKATTAAVQKLFQVASNDAASPLALRFGIKTDATGGSRYGSIEVDDAGTKRPLILQPTGGFVGIGVTPGASSPLSILNSVDGLSTITLQNLSAGTSARLGLSLQNNTGGTAQVYLTGGNYTAVAGWQNRMLLNTDSAITGGILMRPSAGGVTITADASLSNPNFRVDTTGNIGIGQTTFGSGAAKVIALGNGTIPGTIADGFQLVSADVVAGQAAPHFVIENGPVIRLYQQAHIPDADGSLASVNSQLNLLLAAVRNTRLLAAA